LDVGLVRMRGKRVTQEHHRIHVPVDDPRPDLDVAAFGAALGRIEGQIQLVREQRAGVGRGDQVQTGECGAVADRQPHEVVLLAIVRDERQRRRGLFRVR